MGAIGNLASIGDCPTPATLSGLSPEDRAAQLHRVAQNVRRSIVEMIGTARLGHIGGDFSITDAMTTLFFGILRLDPANPN